MDTDCNCKTYHQAIKKRCLPCYDRLLKDKNVKSPSRTIIISIFQNNYLEFIEHMINIGYIKKKSYVIPEVAAKFEKYGLMKKLYEYGCTLTHDCLWYVLHHNNRETLDELIEFFKHVNINKTVGGLSGHVLSEAAGLGLRYFKIIKEDLHFDIPPRLYGEMYINALKNDKKECIEYFIESNMLPDLMPMYTQEILGYVKTVSMLKYLFSNGFVYDKEENTMTYLIANANFDVIDYLIEHKYDEIRFSDLANVLSQYYLEISNPNAYNAVKYLLEKGAHHPDLVQKSHPRFIDEYKEYLYNIAGKSNNKVFPPNWKILTLLVKNNAPFTEEYKNLPEIKQLLRLDELQNEQNTS